MDLTSPENIKKTLSASGVKPSREKGQNFLINREILEKILEAADLGKNDEILEIGPGLGVLTVELARKAGRVVAVEADRRLAEALRKNLKERSNAEIVEGDILRFPVCDFKFKNYGYKIVANLPYQITSAVLRKFLEDECRPGEMTVMVQKEVAERICAPAGKTSLLSLAVQFYGRPEIVAFVPRASFWPEPKVDSAVLKISDIRKISEARIKEIDPEKFFRVAKIGFSARRKQLHNNLSAGLRISDEEIRKIMAEAAIDPGRRAQNLSLDEWTSLAAAIK